MKAVFISPHFPAEQQMFTRGLAQAGVDVYGVADVPLQQLPEDTRRYLADFCMVDIRNDDAAIEGIVKWLQGRGVDRVECLWEPFVTLAAKIRERLGVPGMSVDTVHHFRDKDLMKKRLREGGIRVARSLRVTSAKELREGAEEIGFPVIIKPIAGAGSADTYRLDSQQDIDKILPVLGHVDEGNLEEFIDGDEFTFDAIAINGKCVFHSVTQYHPRPLNSRSNEWISPAQITFANPDIPELADGVKLGFDSLKAMKMGSGFIHMEWFRKPSGEVVLGEIACRNGGGHLVDMMNYANDFDVAREWANAVCWEKFDASPSRQYHVATVFKRAHGQGRITGYEGLHELKQRLGSALICDQLLPVGTPRRDWLQTLVSDGFLMVRHEDYNTVYNMMWDIIKNLKLYAG